MSEKKALHNTPTGACRVYWDTQTEGHHYFRLQAISVFIQDTDEHLVLSAKAFERLAVSVRTTLQEAGRLHVWPQWEDGQSQFDEVRKIRAFMAEFGRPCKIVLVTVCNIQWALALAACNPFYRQYVRHITGDYFRARAVYEKDKSPFYWLKYVFTKWGLSLWASALPKGCFIGSLVRKNVEHYNACRYLKDRFRFVRDFCVCDADPCGPNTRREDDEYCVCLVGMHGPRKGSRFALESLLKHYRLEKTLRIILAGRLKSDPALYESVKAKSERTTIEVHDRFLSDEEIADVYKRSDICLMPYVQFYGSSGVLILSAIHRRPVLASNIGQVGDHVEEYGLGRLFPELDSVAFVRELERMLNEGVSLPEENRQKVFAGMFSRRLYGIATSIVTVIGLGNRITKYNLLFIRAINRAAKSDLCHFRFSRPQLPQRIPAGRGKK